MSDNPPVEFVFEFGSGTDGNKQKNKRRRLERACDHCRRRKVRCDGSSKESGPCSNCRTEKARCTFVYDAPSRSAGTSQNYTSMLEKRLEKAESMLLKFMGRDEFLKEFGGSFCRKTMSFDEDVPATPETSSTETPDDDDSDDHPIHDADTDNLIVELAALIISPPANPQPPVDAHNSEPSAHPRPLYLGQSSGAHLVKAALSFIDQQKGEEQVDQEREAVANLTRAPPSRFQQTAILRSLNLRPQFWLQPTWERDSYHVLAGHRNYSLFQPHPPFEFPPPDLLASLVQIYFETHHVYHPIVHRPTVEKGLRQGLHLTDKVFSTIVMLVCAIGARWSTDPRVQMEVGEDDRPFSPVHTNGWKYFSQVRISLDSLMGRPNALGELQAYSLAILFLMSSSTLPANWLLVGTLIRLAQEVGAHRQKTFSKLSGASAHDARKEFELWKRLWWGIVLMDVGLSCGLGRPPVFREEDCDLDLPCECDDEYWDPQGEGVEPFQQPAGKPSQISNFVYTIKLHIIMRRIMYELYPLNPKAVKHTKTIQQTVSELDSVLNQFSDSLPEHLRWDPNGDNKVFVAQSASLHAQVCQLRILVHQLHITGLFDEPRKEKDQHAAAVAMAICTSSSRSCIRVTDAAELKSGMIAHMTQHAVFMASLILMLGLISNKQRLGEAFGRSASTRAELQVIQQAIDIQARAEDQSMFSGRFKDLIARFHVFLQGDVPVAGAGIDIQKRPRDDGPPQLPLDPHIGPFSSPNVPPDFDPIWTQAAMQSMTYEDVPGQVVFDLLRAFPGMSSTGLGFQTGYPEFPIQPPDFSSSDSQFPVSSSPASLLSNFDSLSAPDPRWGTDFAYLNSASLPLHSDALQFTFPSGDTTLNGIPHASGMTTSTAHVPSPPQSNTWESYFSSLNNASQQPHS